ncbi:MAG: ABC transporter substrate-binding protein [Rhodospirillaceae bacterium]|nr:ABC transporter substrate-binding protein [Rhodospirillaceae bacterium]
MKSVLRLALTAALAASVAGAASAETQGVTANEIVLGSHLDLTGPTAAGMDWLRTGMMMKVDEINAKGGIHGRKLRLIVEDNGLNPAKAVRAVEKLVGSDKVFAVVSSFGTTPNIAAFGKAVEAGVPYLFPWSGVSGPFHAKKSPLVFTNVVDYDWGTAAGVNWAIKQMKPKKIGALVQDDAFGKLVLKGVAEAAKANGMTVAATATFKPTDVDLSAQLTALKNAGVDLVVLGTVVRQTVGAYVGSRQMGWNVNMITSIPGRNQTILAIAAATKASLDGLWGISQWRIHDKGTDVASAKAWIEAYEAKFKKKATMEAMIAYSLIEWTAMALEAAGKDLTVEKFTKALQDLKYADKFGNPTQSLASGNHAQPQTIAVDQVKGGKWVKVSDWITTVQ